MDAIRLRQIDEALGYDKKINTMVFGLEKKRVARYPDKRPESQYDADAETTTKDNIHALPVLLGNRYANISIMQRPGIDVLSDKFSNAKRSVSSRICCANLQHNGRTVGVEPKRDVQTDALEPDAGATECNGSSHQGTYFTGQSYGGRDRRSGYACARILLREVC